MTEIASFSLVALLVLLGGCGSDPQPADTIGLPTGDAAGGETTDTSTGTADVDSAGSPDGSDDGGFDAGPPSDLGTYATPPATIAKTGSGGLLLRGVVLAPDGVLDPGEVLVVGDQIACVAADCSGTSGADTATVVGLDYGKTEQIAALTTKKLWQMATEDGAAVLGLNGPIGQLVVGARADIAVFARSAADPYLTVIDAKARDVRLVLIDGQVYYGDSTLQSLARNSFCEPLDACGTSKFICVSDGPSAPGRDSETMAQIHGQLFDMMEGTGTEPYVEKYGRGAELLELVSCE